MLFLGVHRGITFEDLIKGLVVKHPTPQLLIIISPELVINIFHDFIGLLMVEVRSPAAPAALQEVHL